MHFVAKLSNGNSEIRFLSNSSNAISKVFSQTRDIKNLKLTFFKAYPLQVNFISIYVTVKKNISDTD